MAGTLAEKRADRDTWGDLKVGNAPQSPTKYRVAYFGGKRYEVPVGTNAWEYIQQQNTG